ncbi:MULTISPECIES: efflux RND transporter periplasmic adaptor subunit [unclassified Campylobacter]|uniref:efflux RND transporter periplasmic adaptor subunit n=1 Tax=unclassified Campylobacter TaxID=2593542 RepID=UPI0021E6CB7A|nr:efflux RND transporter periplasmic adaptor subunit [Campylobacter sp. FU_520]MCR8712208.1 efflux RND transporter periplasmic adaptor subunit [Campylobacter sp. W0066.1]MCV3454467.1 efflux RND transporter periplasmic adaptor subunit [Campylobacter sp. FU_520]HEG2606714.1 efflux RND transporter periplasmic adaptor subunit [Campylobacter lari]
MKTKLLTLACASLIFVACSDDKNAQVKQLPPQPVSIMTMQSANLPLEFTYPARLSTELDVIIKPKVSGEIKAKYFKSGQAVKKGDKLFLIEPDKYQASVNMAYGEALVARASFDDAEKNFKRDQILIEKNAISQKEFDASLAKFNSTKANLESARAKLANVRLDLKYTVVSAPFDGVLGDALMDVGDYVNASSTELVRITNINPIFADFYISDVDKINMNKNIQSGNWRLENIQVQANVGGELFNGKLYFIDSVIDTHSGGVKAKAIFDNNNSSLMPGSFANVHVEGFVQKDGFEIPQVALLQDDSATYVYTLVDGKVVKTIVNVIYQTSDKAIIDKGLKNGDKVILNNFKKIRPGASVSVMENK